MSDIDHPPIDVFANLDLAEFKNAKPKGRPLNPAPKVEKEVIRAAAEKGEFISRQPATRRQKIVAKTFSLFQEECDIINAALKAYQDEPDERLSQPSSSDVARAALHAFAMLTPEEQVSYIKEKRGRGRK